MWSDKNRKEFHFNKLFRSKISDEQKSSYKTTEINYFDTVWYTEVSKTGAGAYEESTRDALIMNLGQFTTVFNQG